MSRPKSRMNHPCVLWARKSAKNQKWLLEACRELYHQYRESGGQAFKWVVPNIERIDYFLFEEIPAASEFLNFAKSDAKNLDFTNITDPVLAYNTYLKEQIG